jgi:hypothetical protein
MAQKRQKIHGRGGPVKKHGLISVYPDVELRKKIEAAAQGEHRSLGNMIVEICRRFFAIGTLGELKEKVKQL